MLAAVVVEDACECALAPISAGGTHDDTCLGRTDANLAVAAHLVDISRCQVDMPLPLS